jgi:hypothetical protein
MQRTTLDACRAQLGERQHGRRCTGEPTVRLPTGEGRKVSFLSGLRAYEPTSIQFSISSEFLGSRLHIASLASWPATGTIHAIHVLSRVSMLYVTFYR